MESEKGEVASRSSRRSKELSNQQSEVRNAAAEVAGLKDKLEFTEQENRG